ncbi:unnamed protein product [Moneuplotes crassus]|uniref:F-box domain-containing protein n=1 Tax=Euplotes crassus TaxID=5936 RepID=A0AAD1Y5R9_EUPCR|nr:unnamed protein product [Moneuplotes crassus]
MKLQNVVLREILLFLSLQELMQARLELVSKQFYHNILEDNELLRRMIQNYLCLTKDYSKEQEYQETVLSIFAKEDEHKDQEDLEERKQRPYLKIYDDPSSDVFPVLKKIFREPKSLSFIVQRTTGGQQYGLQNAKSLFNDDGRRYNTGPEEYFPNGVCCISALVYNEELYDEGALVTIYEKANVLNKSIDPYVDLAELHRIKCLKSNQYKIQRFESKTNFEQMLDLLEEPFYSAPKIIHHDKSKAVNESSPHYHTDHTSIMEFNTKVHQELSRDKLFVLKQIDTALARGCSCPFKAFAIFVHDHPVVPEDHALTLIVKGLYDSLQWNKKDPYGAVRTNSLRRRRRNVQEEEKEKKVETNYIEQITNTYQKGFNAGVLPQICESNENWIEFNQKFYSSKLKCPSTNEETKHDFTEILPNSSTSEFLPSLDSEDAESILSDDNYRLAGIVYNLDAQSKTYTIKVAQPITGRHITILGLDYWCEYGTDHNYDFGGVFLKGNLIPSYLTIDD